jgi:drug/metabolite transporter (DMT)-like permease
LAPPSTAGGKSVLAVLLMMVGTSLLPLMDALAKGLVNDGLPALHAAAGRFIAQVVVLGVVHGVMLGLAARRATAAPGEPGAGWGKLDVWRGVFIALGTAFFFSALRYMALPAATAVLLLVPIILALLSHVFLGERVAPARWGVIAVSFLSALVIIRPGSGAFGLASVLPLLSTFCFAGYFLLTRLSARSGSVVATQFIVSVFGLLTLLGIVVGLSVLQPDGAWLVVPVGVEIWGILVSLGLISLVSHFAIFFAMRLGTVPLLAPLIYFELVSATVLSAWMFDELPDPWTIVGAAGLVFATLTDTLSGARKTKGVAPS